MIEKEVDEGDLKELRNMIPNYEYMSKEEKENALESIYYKQYKRCRFNDLTLNEIIEKQIRGYYD